MKYIFYERHWETALTQEVATAVIRDGQVDWFGSDERISEMKDFLRTLRMDLGVYFDPTDEEHWARLPTKVGGSRLWVVEKEL